MFRNIPSEMHFYRQWICWRLEDQGGPKPTKVPYSPIIPGAKASVDKPGTWGGFEDAIAAYESGAFSGIGFVLTDADPYAFIDLDDTKGDNEALQRQQRIFTEFPSYAERSPSGTGLHIICKGKVDRGRKRAAIEVYSNLRFMTMTGEIYRDAPIIDCQETLTLLWHQMGGPAAIHQYGGNAEQKEDDATIIGRALSALNGDKFRELLEGRWEDLYASQSEADFAFVDIVAFYTQNREQITRIFRASPLGARDKAKRNDYVTYMINKSFDRQLPEVDVEGLKLQFEDMLASKDEPMLPGFDAGNGGDVEGPTPPPAHSGTGQDRERYTATAPQQDDGAPGAGQDVPAIPGGVNGSIAFPPGLVGEVAKFIYEAAPRPVSEIALVGAIGFVSGIVGRAFNISATGLNHYTMLLAPTGTGKEAINAGISKLVTAVRPNVPPIQDFIGPAEIRSDAALLKWLAKYPCFVSVTGEFGLRLKQMSAMNASSHEVGLKRVLLDLFNKSGHGNILNPVAYSDKEKNTAAINAPAFSMVGETTPERFYDALDEMMISEGLLPRFLTIEYSGPRPALNENAPFAQPSFALIEMVQAITVHCLEVMAKGSVVNVQMDEYADRLMRDFDRYCDAQINDRNSREVTRHMWNRAHIKALKLSALVAVGVYPYKPVVDRVTAQWATDIVVRDILNVIGRFDRGEVGTNALGVNEQRQIDDMVRVIADWMRGDGSQCAKYGMPGNMHAAGIILGSALNKRLMAMASYRNDRSGASGAIKRTIQFLLDGDELREIPKGQMQSMFGTTARGFAISRPSTFA
jgi:hypothetical protein